MNEDSRVQVLEEQLRQTLGSPAKTDFESWRDRHGDAVAYLNPVVTELYRRRRRMAIGMGNVAAAAIVLGVLCWILFPGQASFAEAMKAINEAETISWTWAAYTRYHSKDGKRTWLQFQRTTFAYRHPGLYRHTYYDEEGTVAWVTIVDARSGKTLSLDMKNKKIHPRGPGSQSGHNPQGPFGWVVEVLKTKPLELAGQRIVDGKTVNVIRYRNETMPDKQRNSVDLWVDAQTKQLVGFSEPGADVFDPATMADRPAEKEWSRAEPVGSITREIVFDAKLAPELFSLTAPERFELLQRPPVTEADLVQWLRLTARVNNNTFVESMQARGNANVAAAMRKDVADRNDVEAKLFDVYLHHARNDNYPPILKFREESTVGDSFRYVGTGVRLGAADRIVCWYRLKGTGKLRAIFGDLTVKDIEPSDLPLPVDP